MWPKVGLTLAVLAAASCRASESHQKALSEWKRNEKIIETAVKQGKSSEDTYLQANIFFYDVTGIAMSGNATTFGLVPDEHTAKDLERIKKWCSMHCQKLYWDEKSNSVKYAK